MIHPQEAIEIIQGININRQIETVMLSEAYQRHLSKDVYARIDSPPFSKSAMDGYAIIAEDDREEYEILEIIPAGKCPKYPIKPGYCSKIMTGAMIPENCTKVIRVEFTEEIGNVMRKTQNEPYENIIKQGENHKSGDILLKANMLNAQQIGILASEGIAQVEVYQRPRVGVISTGSELKEPGESLEKGSIYNSNSSQLIAQIQSMRIDANYYGIAKDEHQHTTKIIQEALNENDIVILSGGVSMGDFDYVPQILKENGIELLIQSIAIKPGKPTVFGTGNGKYVFGLPGNPVSTFILFEVFVRGFINRFMGYDYQPFSVKGIMRQGIKRRDTSRFEYRPVIYRNGEIFSAQYHGSAHLDVFSQANALLCLGIGCNEIKEGEEISVRLI